MAVSLFAADRGYLNEVAVDKVGTYEVALINYLKSSKKDLLDKINEKGDFNEQIEAELKAALDEFTKAGSW